MKNIYHEFAEAKANKRKLLAILIDPDKVDMRYFNNTIEKINASPATHVLVGGSSIEIEILDELVSMLRNKTALPIILFPGNSSQISAAAHAILFLSLISGRNPDYLIEQHVKSVPVLKKTNLEIIPTGYVLIESGAETAVERVSKTIPLERNNPDFILQTVEAGIMLGLKLIYLEAGSGARSTVPLDAISLVSHNIDVPLIVGGGIKNMEEIHTIHNAGADLVVIGTAFETNLDFFS